MQKLRNKHPHAPIIFWKACFLNVNYWRCIYFWVASRNWGKAQVRFPAPPLNWCMKKKIEIREQKVPAEVPTESVGFLVLSALVEDADGLRVLRVIQKVGLALVVLDQLSAVLILNRDLRPKWGSPTVPPSTQTWPWRRQLDSNSCSTRISKLFTTCILHFLKCPGFFCNALSWKALSMSA